MNRKTLVILLLLVPSLAMWSGCDARAKPNYAHLDLIPVTGTITLDGQPLAGAVVVFTDTETRKFSYDMTDAAGNYKLHFDSQEMGILAGEKVVEVSMTRKILGLNSEEDSGSEEGKPKAEKLPADAIPECYRKDSQIRVNVSGDKTVYDFNLKSDCSTSTAS